MNSGRRKAIISDIDDVVSDFCGNLIRVHNAFHGTRYTRNILSNWEMPKEIRSTFKKYEHDLYVSQPIIAKVKEKLAALKRKGYYIILMTARDASFKEATVFNLAINGIQYDKLIFSKNKSLKINRLMKKFDVRLFVDDRVETINKVAANTNVPNVYLVTRSYNRNVAVHPRVKRIFNLEDVKC